MNTTIALVPLLNLGYAPAIDLTWRLLLERPTEANISHSTMPTMDQHREFVFRAPYAAWYAILNQDEVPVGTVLLTRRNEIGIAILKEYQGNGYAEAAIRQLIEANTPADGVPAQRAGHFLANVAPTNEASISLFNKLGGRVIQWTYRL